MNYISVENISKSYGDRTLFKNLSFGINKNQKVAFVAKNGTGKTSILNIIAGLDTPDEGQVIQRKDIQIAYLSQNQIFDDSLSVEQTIFATENRILPIIKQYEKALENPEDSDNYQKAFDLMDQHNAWDFETQYKLVLSKLKLTDLSMKVGKLSGGQKKRLSLAILLINKPDLIILDEPTNDLDVVTLNVLENFLLDFPGNLLVVSHDRYFMDKVVDSLFVFRGDAVIEHFPGNYSDFRAYEDSAPKEKVVVQKNTNTQIKTSTKNTLSYNEKREFEKLEKSISKLNAERIDIESQFANGEIEADKIAEVSQNLQKTINYI